MLTGVKTRIGSQKVVECGMEIRRLYFLVKKKKNITGRAKVNPMPPGKKNATLTEEFAIFSCRRSQEYEGSLMETQGSPHQLGIRNS